MRIYAAIVVFVAFAVVTAGGQQTGPASWNGTYTDAQARRGQTLYTANCGACHSGDLSGGDRAPALTGSSFFGKWSARGVGELVDYVHSVMPLQSPGGLSRQQSADIVAFILSKGQITPGQTELSA